ncbi:hypothetical protein JTE90_017182 [Oedothorax gibbosus]|uniref:Uncharacterized protein n=1 Tax=Oedothorax gibbosus TaxID=931172 RepID=A0AAV6V8X3_9ARAC|nr:hypothetical protein JTE90_017182 [Oedothorax gibbosus]
MKLNRFTHLLFFVLVLACHSHASDEGVSPTETPPHHTRSLLFFPIFPVPKPISIFSKPPPQKDDDQPKQSGGGLIGNVLQGGSIGIEIRPLAPFQGVIDHAKKILPGGGGGHGTVGRPSHERPGHHERPHHKPEPGDEGPYEPEDEKPHHPQPGYQRPHNQRPGYERPHPQRPGYQRPHEQRPGFERPHEPEPGHDRPHQERPGYERPHPQQPGYERPHPQRPGNERPHPQRPGYERPHPQRPGNERPHPQRPGYERPHPQRPGYERPEPEIPHPDNEKPQPELPKKDENEPLTEEVPGWEDIGEGGGDDEYGDGILMPRKKEKRPKRFVDSRIYHVPLKYVSNGRTHRVRRIRNGLADIMAKDA